MQEHAARGPLISASVLSADFTRLRDEVQAVEAAGADWLHVDVMDGRFAPNLTMGPFIVEALRRLSRLPLDVHLMIHHPEHFAERFVKSGAGWLNVHLEAEGDPPGALETAVKFGAHPALTISPATPVSAARDWVGRIEMLLVMSVNPGFSGQKMIPETLTKFPEARRLFGPKVLLEIDGGVTAENSAQVRAAGADVIIAATAIFKSPDYAAAVKVLKGQAPPASARTE